MKKVILSLSTLLFSTLYLSAEKVSPWEHSISLGFNLARGNNDSTQFNTSIEGEKNTESHQVSYGLIANVGDDDGEQTTNNYNAEAQYDKNYTKYNYWLVTASLDIDKIAELDSRIYLGPGLGYRFIKTEQSNLDLEGGLAFLRTKYSKLSEDESLAYRIAEKFSHKLSSGAKVWQSAEILGDTDETDSYVIKAQLGVQTSILDGFNLKSYISNTYNNDPATGKEKNDTSFVTMLVYKF